ncbi:MAG TPA: EF-hand domain-containing protein, partial [Candidatus Hydrogenedentes bacterium]|nr:EF-hand domain-containing protein [Candidatus Hydrogenedentota bacterium]
AGVVIRQYPAAGVTLTCGTAVNLLVSLGAPDKVPTNREVMKQIHDKFKDLDTNGDGTLTLEEVRAALPNLPVDIFDLIDTNGDGQLTLDELKNYLKINGCFGCVKRLFVKDLLVSAGGDLLLAGLGLALLISALQRRNSH